MEAQATASSSMRVLIAEASQALARLDASRLEELALSCQALNREFAANGSGERMRIVLEIGAAASEMEILARVLEATRQNLRVMQRLRELRGGRIEYTKGASRQWTPAEVSHGHD